MKPLIGIIGRVEYPGGMHKLIVNEANRIRLLEMGADILMILPPQRIDYGDIKFGDQPILTDEEKEMLIREINLCDGIYLPGGFKLNIYDRFIADYVIEHDIPTLGVCLGMQILSNYKRENVWNEKNDSKIEHKQPDVDYVHSVKINKDSKLYNIVQKEEFMVNSRHGYHIVENDNFDNVAFSDDGYIEAIEMKDKKYIIGVQWHPENLKDEESYNIYKAFIDACRR